MIKVIYIPNGPKNLAALFPNLNFRDIEDYTVALRKANADPVCESTLNVIKGCDDEINIHFVNYLGTIDAISFHVTNLDSETKSDTLEAPTSYPLVKSLHAAGRFNVKSNDSYTATSVEYDESAMDWLNELFDSPVAWMEWPGEQGQPDDYIPIVISDKKFNKRKQDDRFTYEVAIEFKLSHERILLRN